jgi:hypothetical protein
MVSRLGINQQIPTNGKPSVFPLSNVQSLPNFCSLSLMMKKLTHPHYLFDVGTPSAMRPFTQKLSWSMERHPQALWSSG